MFHLAFPILDIKETIKFYTQTLNAKIGRTGLHWADFDFYGNQITVQKRGNFKKKTPIISRDGIPVTHFGIILELLEWHKLKEELESKNVKFLIAPKLVFEGEVGEQYSFFVEDPNGYSIEFKGFKSLSTVFQKQ